MKPKTIQKIIFNREMSYKMESSQAITIFTGTTLSLFDIGEDLVQKFQMHSLNLGNDVLAHIGGKKYTLQQAEGKKTCLQEIQSVLVLKVLAIFQLVPLEHVVKCH